MTTATAASTQQAAPSKLQQMKPDFPQRPPKRKAVVVGCNYSESGNISLRGAVNDAHLFALSLVNLFDVSPKNILLLTDTTPDDIYRNPLDPQIPTREEVKSRLPVRTHIAIGLRWLIRDAKAGDTLIFYFAGHGLQVDDMCGWEGEGYDECILPMDCCQLDGEVNAMITVGIRKMLLSVDEGVQVAIFLDCTGGQTMLDPAGTGSWSYIRGVKQRGIWPIFTDPTDKMERAKYDQTVWLSEAMRKKEVRPRFVPGVEVSNSAELADIIGTRGSALGGCKARAFLLAAAPFDQVAIEARLPSVALRCVRPNGKVTQIPIIPSNKPVIHGVYTWALVRAMNEVMMTMTKASHGDKIVSWKSLSTTTQRNLKLARSKHGLVKMNQMCELTFYCPSGSNSADFVFYPHSGTRSKVKYDSATERDHPTINSEGGYFPKRGEYLNIWQVENTLMDLGQQATKSKYWTAAQEKYKKDWEMNFKRKNLTCSPLLKSSNKPTTPSTANTSRPSPPPKLSASLLKTTSTIEAPVIKSLPPKLSSKTLLAQSPAAAIFVANHKRND